MLNATLLTKFVDDLGAKRAQLAALQADCDMLADTVKKALRLRKAKHGEGAIYVAELVKMPQKVMRVKAHVQLRTRALQ